MSNAAYPAPVEANPFSHAIRLVSNAELISWSAVSERLAAGPLAGDVDLAAQRAFVAEEMRVRRMLRPAGLSKREQREMGEGQE